MKKYLSVVKTEWQRQLTYRATILSFRIGNIFELLIQLVIWSAIFRNVDTVKGYSYEEMITYILVGWLVLFLTSNFNLDNHVARQIHKGTLSNFLSKPISYIRYITYLSFGRVSLALLSGVIVQSLFIILFQKSIVITNDPALIIIAVFMIFIGFFIKLNLSIIVGFLAFWITEVSGVHFSLKVIQRFLSGAYFPTSLFPNGLVQIISCFPFVYTFFIPTQVILGKTNTREALIGLGVEIVWLFLLMVIVRILWKFGLKKYESIGI